MSGAAQPSWNPPEADRQPAGWKPPESDRAKKPYDAVARGAKMGGSTDPNALGDSFVGTLATDAAKLPGQIVDLPLQAIHGMQHPVDAITNLAHQIYNLPGETLQMLKDGKYGKLAARVVEAFGPEAATEGGAELAANLGAKAKAAAAPVTRALETAGTVAKAGVKAAAPDVAAGATKAAVGAAAAEVLPVGPIKYALGAAPAYAGARQIGRGVSKGFAAGKAALSERIAKATDSLAAAEAMTPGQALAQETGADWAKLSAEDQAMLEHAAKARANAAEQPEQPAPQPQPQAPAEPPAQPGPTLAEMIRDEVAAKKPAASPAAESPQPLQGGHAATPPTIRGGAPLRPPVRTSAPPPGTEVIQPQTPAVAEAGPAVNGKPGAADIAAQLKAEMERSGTVPPDPSAPAPTPAPKQMTYAQAEAAMARRKAPVVTPEEARRAVTPTGETKSPELRGAERMSVNIEAKAQRIADALHQFDVTAADVRNIPSGRLSASQIAQGGTPGWENVVDSLIEKGVLKEGELPPTQSIPRIIAHLKKMEASKARAAR